MDGEQVPRVVLLEFDERFEVFEGWVRFDFDMPDLLPRGLKGGFDAVLVDPPYHSEDCARKCEWFRIGFVYGRRLIDWLTLLCRCENSQMAFQEWINTVEDRNLHGREHGTGY